MRCNVLQCCSLATASHHVPDDVLRDASAPDLSTSRNCPKDPSLCNPGCRSPLIECLFCPKRNRNRTNVTALADQIDNRPVALARLNVVHLQPGQLGAPETATE